MKMADIIHIILLLVGLALLILGINLFIHSKKLLNTGIKTEATVIDNVPVQSESKNGSSILYTPVMEYKVKGDLKTYIPNSSSNPPAYEIGEKVPIVYSAKNPASPRIISFWGVYLGSNILFITGLPMLLTGAGYFLFKMGII